MVLRRRLDQLAASPGGTGKPSAWMDVVARYGIVLGHECAQLAVAHRLVDPTVELRLERSRVERALAAVDVAVRAP